MVRNTKVWLCKDIPFLSDYTHHRLFNSAGETYNFFISKAFYYQGECSYQREESYFMVELSYEGCFEATHLVFQNPGGQFVYNFVTKIEYYNELTTKVYFETDVLSTFLPLLNITPCFVEREHVSDDTPGKHILPEPVNIEHICVKKQIIEISDMDVFGQFTYFEKLNELLRNETAFKKLVYLPGVLKGIPQSCYSIFLGKYNNSVTFDNINYFLRLFETAGALDTIQSIFCVPSVLSPTSQNDTNIYRKTIQVENLSLDGSVRNNKLKTFPFTFMEMTADGQSQLIKYENFGDFVEITGGFFTNPVILCYPMFYDGIQNNINFSVTCSNFPILPWSKNNYQNWVAQNKANQLVNIAKSTITGYMAGGYAGAAIAGGSSLLGTLQNNYSQSFSAPTQVGQVQASDLLAYTGKKEIAFTCKSLPNAMLAQADTFLTTYGYNVSTMKVPNFRSRKYFNFVKTKNCSFTGSVRGDYLRKIREIFDRGVTLWHIDTINYNVNNSIVRGRDND